MSIYEDDFDKVTYEAFPYTKIYNKLYKEESREYTKQEYEPLISTVIPVYNVLDDQLRECIDSICAQTYPNWELYLVDDNSSWESVRDVLREYEDNPKINVIYRKENGHISEATNDGIFAAKGEFIAFMDCDDFIEPYSFAEMVYYLNEHPDTDFIYSDEDKVDDYGKNNHYPFLKPNWSPDTFWSMMYTNHLAMYRREIVCKIGGLRTICNGSQDYDMTLRFMEHSDNKRVGHVPRILYHWRERPESAAASLGAKPYAIEAAGRAKEEAIARRGLDAKLEFIPDLFQYRIRYFTPGDPLVSIVIPSKDNPAILFQCIDSLIDITEYKNYEIIVVDNGSNDENKEIIKSHLDRCNVTYIYEKMDFNFSKMCNMGVKASHGDYVLLLNDDIEIIEKEWLDRMLGQAMQEHTGAVGAKLLYPHNRTIQHIGISNIAVGPSHMFMGTPDEVVVSFCRNRLTFDWLAVTGACLMVSRALYDEVGGLDEELTVAYNDVDLCFKLYEAGYYNVARMDCVLYHHESLSRGFDSLSDEKKERLRIERNHLFRNHKDLFGYDPFYNVNLAGDRLDFEMEMYDTDVHHCDITMSHKKFRPKATSMLLSVDEIKKGDYIRIAGWASSGDSNRDLHAKRYLMLRNRANQIYFVPVSKIGRPQIMEELNIENMTEGFECKIDRKILATGVYDYDIGIMQVDESGRSEYVWSDKTMPADGIEELKSSQYKFYSREENFDSSCVNDKVRYCIDEHKCDAMVNTTYGVFPEMTYITGWAMAPKGNSYDYRIDIGMVNDNTSTITLFDTVRFARYDVADSTKRNESYLVGFKTQIPAICKDKDRLYVVLTNMENNRRYMREITL